MRDNINEIQDPEFKGLFFTSRKKKCSCNPDDESQEVGYIAKFIEEGRGVLDEVKNSAEKAEEAAGKVDTLITNTGDIVERAGGAIKNAESAVGKAEDIISELTGTANKIGTYLTEAKEGLTELQTETETARDEAKKAAKEANEAVENVKDGEPGETGPSPVLSSVEVEIIPYGQKGSGSVVQDGETEDGVSKYKISLKLPAGKNGIDGTGAGNAIIENAGLSAESYGISPVQDGSSEYVLVKLPTKTSDLGNDSGFQSDMQVEAKIGTHNTSETAHQDIRTEIQRVYNIVTGTRVAIVFDNQAQLTAWIADTYERPDGIVPADLKIGESIYLRSLDEPDYWWDGSQALKQETEKVDLSNFVTLTAGDARYALKTDLPATDQIALLDFMSGSKTMTSLASLILDKQIIYATASANQSISVSSRVVDGQPSHIYVRNTTATDLTITLPTTGSYISMSGVSKTLPASGYMEISIAYDPEISKYRITVLEAE